MRPLNYVHLCSFLLSSVLSVALGQLPFFLQRFRPIRHGLAASGSNPYGSLLSPTSSFSFSPPQQHQNSLSSLLLQSAASTPSLFGSYPSSLFSPASFGGTTHSTSSNGHPLGFSPPSGFGTFNSHPFESSGLSQLYQHHHSNPLGSSSGLSLLADLGTAGGFEGGLGGYDHAELLEDYPGFSSAGFAKDLNFAGSQPVRFQSPSPNPYSGLQFYLQRSA